MNTNKSVFITGGSGFIAPHLLDFLDASCLVTLHVRDVAKAAKIRAHPNLHIVSGSLADSEMQSKIPEDCDAVIHLAGAVYGPNVEAILDSNIVTTQNVLAIMEARRIPKIVFMSTASVWSDSAGVTLCESTETNPSTLYGYAKLSAERLIADAIFRNNISSAVVLRCNNTYGPGGTQGAVANFLACLLKNEPLQINGDGQQLREPLYVTDLVEVIIKALSKSSGMHIYGISGPEAMTILTMAQTLADSLERSMEIDWKPENPDRARHIILNTEKARRELNWTPHVHYKEGISVMCKKYNNTTTHQ